MGPIAALDLAGLPNASGAIQEIHQTIDKANQSIMTELIELFYR
jgi:hypothetical protein